MVSGFLVCLGLEVVWFAVGRSFIPTLTAQAPQLVECGCQNKKLSAC